MLHEYLSLLVRWVHVAGMSFMLGGTLLLWGLASRPGQAQPAEHGRQLIGWAEYYERLFWLAAGLQVMTGVGNLGALGVGLPGPETAWGARLGLKLLAVLFLLVLSVLRTIVIVRFGAAANLAPLRTVRVLAALYGGTALSLAGIVLLAVAMAHA